jgi:uncharacterized protein (UPF0248 family)
MKLLVFAMLGMIALGGLLGALASRLRYVLTDRHLKVTLFGLCLRRIRLADIESVSKRQAHRAEKWYNTLKPAHRILVIRRRRGLFKDFIITPRNRYVFKTELEQTLAKVQTVDANQRPDCLPLVQGKSPSQNGRA